MEVSIKKLLNWSRSQDCSSQPPCWGTSEHHRAQLKSTQPGPGTLNTVEAQVSHNESFFCNFPSVMRCCRSKIPAGLYCCFTLIEGSFSKPQFQALHSQGVCVELKLVSKQALRIHQPLQVSISIDADAVHIVAMAASVFILHVIPLDSSKVPSPGCIGH